jgi:hypothetical protein
MRFRWWANAIQTVRDIFTEKRLAKGNPNRPQKRRGVDVSRIEINSCSKLLCFGNTCESIFLPFHLDLFLAPPFFWSCSTTLQKSAGAADVSVSMGGADALAEAIIARLGPLLGTTVVSSG